MRPVKRYVLATLTSFVLLVLKSKKNPDKPKRFMKNKTMVSNKV
jgi:hypothetical protein